MSFLTAQNAEAAIGKSSIARDGMVRSLKAGLRTAMQAEYAGRRRGLLAPLDDWRRIRADRNDQAQRRQVECGAEGVAHVGADLLTQAFAAVDAQVNDYARAGGLIQKTKDRLKDQIIKIDSRLDTMQLQLDLRRMALQKEFTAADLLMTQLKGQSSSLQALNGQYRLF